MGGKKLAVHKGRGTRQRGGPSIVLIVLAKPAPKKGKKEAPKPFESIIAPKKIKK